MRMMVVVVISIISATLKLVVVVKYQDRDRLGMLSRPNNNNPIKDNGMSGETKKRVREWWLSVSFDDKNLHRLEAFKDCRMMRKYISASKHHGSIKQQRDKEEKGGIESAQVRKLNHRKNGSAKVFRKQRISTLHLKVYSSTTSQVLEEACTAPSTDILLCTEHARAGVASPAALLLPSFRRHEYVC